MGVVLRDGGERWMEGLGSGSYSSGRWRTGKWELFYVRDGGLGSGSCSSGRWRTGEWELFL